MGTGRAQRIGTSINMKTTTATVGLLLAGNRLELIQSPFHLSCFLPFFFHLPRGISPSSARFSSPPPFLNRPIQRFLFYPSLCIKSLPHLVAPFSSRVSCAAEDFCPLLDLSGSPQSSSAPSLLTSKSLMC